jgi:Mrp family chromosome partitioning ATPase
MVTSPGEEPSRATVAVNLATVCAEIGQRVVVVTTEGFDTHLDGLEPRGSAGPLTDDERNRRLTGPLRPDEVRHLLGDTSVPGVSFLDLQHFVAHTTQVVIRVPEVLDALREVVDVVILEVPSFLSVHHGQGLAPLADLVLVVGERRLTTLDDLRKTSAVLKRLGAPVVGMALTSPSVRDDDEDEDEDEDEGRHKPRRRSARKRPKDQADGEDGNDGARLSPADTTTVTDVTSFDVTTLVDQASLRLRTEPEDPAIWDRPARPEA